MGRNGFLIRKRWLEKNLEKKCYNYCYCFICQKGKIDPGYVSKHNSNCEKQVIFLMIPNGKKWHYLTVKNLLVLLTWINSKHHDHFYCLNCLHSFAI